jgi:hypothetical protein
VRIAAPCSLALAAPCLLALAAACGVQAPLPGGPSIQLSAGALHFEALAGGAGPPPQVVTVTNAGNAPLAPPVLGAVAYEGGAAWLDAAVSGTAAPFGITVRVATEGLAAGTWRASFPVSSPGAANSPRTVTVTCTVAPSYRISGRVTGKAVAGVTVELSGAASAAAVTDASGGYVFDALAGGDYAVTPSGGGALAFTPVSRGVTVAGSDVSGQDFSSWLPCAGVARWESRASGTASDLRGVASSGARAVAAGAGGTLRWSADGAAWAPASPALPPGDSFEDVAYGEGLFVAVGTSVEGTQYGGLVATSADGVAWTHRDSATSRALTGVAYGNGVFVAVGYGGALQRSEDGIRWTLAPPRTVEHLYGVAFVNGRFVATGNSGTILASEDGAAWEATSAGAGTQVNGVAFGGGLYVAVGAPMAGGGAARILTSTDLATWTDRSPAARLASLRRVAHAGGVFVATGSGVVTSSDGINWSCPVTPPAGAFAGGGLAWDGSRFLMAGAGGAILAASPGQVPCSASAWTAIASGATANLQGVAGSGAVAVAVGRSGTALWSGDAVDWAPASPALPPVHSLFDVAYGEGVFVAVGTDQEGLQTGGLVLTSADGMAWAPQASATTMGLMGVAYGDGAFVAVGNLGSLQVSPDGAAWSTVETGTTEHLDGVSFVNGRFVATGHSGTILASGDGAAWTAMNVDAGIQVNGIAHGAGLYVAVGHVVAGGGAARILTSPDLVTWTDRSPVAPLASLRRVVYAAGVFVAAGSGVLTSSDGITWSGQVIASAGPIGWGGVAWDGSRFLVAGNGGTILVAP